MRDPHTRSLIRPWRCRCGETYSAIHASAQRAARIVEAERAEQAAEKLIIEIESIPVDQARERFEREVRGVNAWRAYPAEQRQRRNVR